MVDNRSFKPSSHTSLNAEYAERERERESEREREREREGNAALK